MNNRPPLVGGWHDLPGGGSIDIKNGRPWQICDKGNPSLEETRMLAEAVEYTDMPILWV